MPWYFDEVSFLVVVVSLGGVLWASLVVELDVCVLVIVVSGAEVEVVGVIVVEFS